MNSPNPATDRFKPLPILWAIACGLVASVAYGFTFATHYGPAAILIALPCLCLLGRLPTGRQAFYGGMIVGMAIYVPHLVFFWRIFGKAAIPLYLIAGMPIGIFLLLQHLAYRRFSVMTVLWMTPIFWTGVEYFRSELYYFRFAWLLPGQAAAFLPGVRMAWLGVYGLGFFFMLAAALVVGPRLHLRVIGTVTLLAFATFMYLPGLPTTAAEAPLHIAGVQLEHPDERAVAKALDHLAATHPEAQILVLCEYTFFGPIPESVRKVIRKHHRYLIAGGARMLPDYDAVTAPNRYYDTAFVIGPDGRDVFSQAKSVPVQCMRDGLAAGERRVWESPWGKIGIAVCYDLSYTRVMDDFVRQGAQGLIIPTMDEANWGEYERQMLHGRMAPIRSAEYGIPTFGVWSSGKSQLTDRYGQVVAMAGYPGQGEMIAGSFNLEASGHVPMDRWVALAATLLTGLFFALIAIEKVMAIHPQMSRTPQIPN